MVCIPDDEEEEMKSFAMAFVYLAGVCAYTYRPEQLNAGALLLTGCAVVLVIGLLGE